LLMRGVDPVLLLRELLGRSDGLCGGMGGHMHLFSRKHLAASSGIVGAAGPAAAGFALAAQMLHPRSVAVAFFGEGSMNQGMLMESMNLAAVWNLPVLFVCKDDGWAITTQPEQSTAGDLEQRAQGLGVPAVAADGREVTSVWDAAGKAIERARAGLGPTFLHACCVHLEGHFLGLQLIRLLRDPLREIPPIPGPLLKAALQPGGAPLRERLEGLGMVFGIVIAALRDPRRDPDNDPIRRTRLLLRADPGRLQRFEDQIRMEMDELLASAVAEGTS
jgi:acetoin:2,6-dichlorophenolindophenol oxidoreductase subunit alpha